MRVMRESQTAVSSICMSTAWRYVPKTDTTGCRQGTDRQTAVSGRALACMHGAYIHTYSRYIYTRWNGVGQRRGGMAAVTSSLGRKRVGRSSLKNCYYCTGDIYTYVAVGTVSHKAGEKNMMVDASYLPVCTPLALLCGSLKKAHPLSYIHAIEDYVHVVPISCYV